LEAFAPPVVLVKVPLLVKMENAGKNHFYKFHRNEYNNNKISFKRCPANSGSFGGFCSSGCSCSNQYECLNGTCGYIRFLKLIII
jgi:hypothetical protein